MRKVILSINSSRPMNYMLQTVLSDKFRFISSPDVFSALKQLKLKPEVDLLVIDADFNGADVWDFVKHIKSSAVFAVPVIALVTNMTQVPDTINLDFCFQKPFNPVDFIKTIETLLINKPSPVYN